MDMHEIQMSNRTALLSGVMEQDSDWWEAKKKPWATKSHTWGTNTKCTFPLQARVWLPGDCSWIKARGHICRLEYCPQGNKVQNQVVTFVSNGCQTLSNTILTLGYRTDVRISTYKKVKSIVKSMKVYGNKISDCDITNLDYCRVASTILSGILSLC